MDRYPVPRAGRYQPAGEQRTSQGEPSDPALLGCGYYPDGRPRAALELRGVGLRYSRYESNNETTLGDTNAEVITFSGKPDAITLSVRAFPAIVTLTDRLNRETSTILVQVGTPIETLISRERVVARNAIAASAAILNVVGKWLDTAAADSEYDPPQAPPGY